MSIFVNDSEINSSTEFYRFHVKHRKWEPEVVHGQLEGCNRNLRPKAAVAKVYTHGIGVVVPAVRLPACRVLVGPQKEHIQICRSGSGSIAVVGRMGKGL